MTKSSLVRVISSCAAALLVMHSASSAFAAAFELNTQDAAANGRGDAFTANPTNGSAIWYNPAGIANLEGFQIDVGTTFIAPTFTYTNLSTNVSTNSVSGVDFLPELYLTYRFEGLNKLFSVGLGVNAPFGGNIAWKAGSPAAPVARQQTIQALYISPELGLNFSQWVKGLSLAGGVDIVDANVFLSQDLPFGNQLGTSRLGAGTIGVGGRVGVIYQPQWVDGLSLGFVYRSPVKLSFNSGDAAFSAPPEFRASLPPDGTAKTSFNLPQTIAAGVSYKPVAPLELEVDLLWTGWSTFKSLIVNLPGGSTLNSPKDYKDTFGVNVGLEWHVIAPLALRAGFSWEQSPIPPSTVDFTLPDTTHYVGSLGIGYQFIPQFRVDASVQYNFKGSVTTDGQAPQVQGRFDVSAFIAGLNFGVALGRPAATAPDSPAVVAPPPPPPAPAPVDVAPMPAPVPAPAPQSMQGPAMQGPAMQGPASPNLPNNPPPTNPQ